MPAIMPWRAQSRGVTTCRTSGSAPRCGNRAVTVSNICAGVRIPVGVPILVNHRRIGSRGQDVQQVAAVRGEAGSPTVGRVTSSDGSAMGRPWSMIWSKACGPTRCRTGWCGGSHPLRDRRARRPIWATTADGAGRNRVRFGAGGAPQQPVGVRQVGGEDHRVGREPLAGAGAHRGHPTAGALQPGDRWRRSGIRRRQSAAAAASAPGSARIPPRGKYTPATVSM